MIEVIKTVGIKFYNVVFLFYGCVSGFVHAVLNCSFLVYCR